MKSLRRIVTLLLVAGIALCRSAAAADTRPPNVVIVFADDLGYADLGCYGAKGWKTPHLDRLASEGVRFTSFYVAQAVCSASRTALLTGCYPNRVGILGALGPASTHGIHDDETTLAEVLRSRGYATAIYGKWHLGHHPQFLPTRHGFDDYFGLPYSNDMWPLHPTAGKRFPDLPLIEGENVKQPKVTAAEQRQLTTWYTERATAFIERNQDRPFFLYVPHSMPHVPIYVSDRHAASSQQGLYGDVIQEIDWSVGQIVAALKKHDLEKHTLVIFTSDNGPWLSYGDHAGTTGPLREGKGTTFEGGVRVPCIMRWPGHVPAGKTCGELAATIDLLPTLASLASAKLPERRIDGRDIWPLIAGKPGAASPHEAYYLYWGQELQAVRSGRWKLHFPHSYTTLSGRKGGTAGQPARYDQAKIGRALFDLESDVGETTDVAETHADVVERLQALAEKAREDLGDSLTKRQGKNVRAAGRIVKEKTP
jgi:arylsulfatase A-like enzyme